MFLVNAHSDCVVDLGVNLTWLASGKLCPMSHHVNWLGIIGCLCNIVLLKLWLHVLHVSLRLVSWCSLMPQYLSESGTMTRIMPRPSQIRIRRFWCSVCQLYFKSLESVWSFKANLMCFMVCISSTWRWNPAYCNSLLPPLDHFELEQDRLQV